MKILFNCLDLEKGGAQRVISVLANHFSTNNEVSILMLRQKNIRYEINKNISLFAVTKIKKMTKLHTLLAKISIIKLIKMQLQIKKINPDIIISFLPEPSLKLMFLKKFNGQLNKIPTIVSVRNDPSTEYKNKIINIVMRHLYQKAEKIVLQTDEAFLYFAKFFKKDKLAVIPNPVDYKFLISKPYNGRRLEQIVNVGRLVTQKNQKLLIEAFLQVLTKYPHLKLLIYGSGPLERELKSYVKHLNLENKVFFKGEVDDIKTAILKAKMFVLSSDYEGMPNALMEAMALGIPCVSTNCPCGGPKYLIKNEENGLLVPIKDSNKLAIAMLKLLDDENLNNKISRNAFLTSKQYKPSKICSLWEKEIFKILSKNGDKLTKK